MKRAKLALWSGALFCLFVAGFFLLSQDRFYLNRVVRNVDLRLLQFQKLSDKRNERFKIQISAHSLTVFNYQGDQEEWIEYLSYPFSGGITCEEGQFEVVFDDGALGGLSLGTGERILQSNVILYFVPENRASPKKGIIFYGKSGDWRVLRKKI